jgi:hypothetical protein
MTFRRSNDVIHLPDDFVARESVWWRAVGVIISLAIWGVIAWLPPLRGWWLGWVVTGLVALLPLLFISQWMKTLNPQNWILRITGRNVLVKFRSFANAHFSDDNKVVVSFAVDEIAWASQRRETFISPGTENGETSQQYFTYLDLGLKNVDVAMLERQLADERRRRPPPAMIETIQRDYPVQLANRSDADGPVLQICWRGESNWITPSIKKTLAALSQITTILEPTKTTLDVTKSSGSTVEGAALDDQSRILALAERGQMLGAVKLTCQCYGYSLAEAKQFVEELCGTAKVDRGKVRD